MEFIKPTVQIKLYGLDHLRALAIILVFLFHYQFFFGHPEWFPKIIKFCWTGVDLFFVLSGFLISSQLFAQIKKKGEFSIKKFYLKRFFRIIPVYLAVVGIYFCFPFFRERETLPPLWKFLTFTQNLGLKSNELTFSHAWSLCVEEHFYLFLPLFLIFFLRTSFFKKSYLTLIFLFLVGFVIRFYCWNQIYLPKISGGFVLSYWGDSIYYPTYNRLDGLIMGVSIAALYQYSPKLFSKVSKFGNSLILLGILVLTFVYFFCSEFASFSLSIFGFPLIAIGYGLMVLGALSPTSLLYKWNSKTTTFIATLSYAIYLSHKGLIHMFQQIFSNWGIVKNSNLMLLICLTLSVVGAWVLNSTIEKPFMRLRWKIIKEKNL